MTWFKVDDRLHSHPKAIAAGTPAMGLWVLCGSWSSAQLQDGHVPLAIARMYGTPALARSLVKSGLWDEVEGGYQFHDWEDRNPLKEHVETVREARRQTGQIGGKASGKARAKPKQNASTSPDVSLPDASTLSNPRPGPVPSRSLGDLESPSSAVDRRDPQKPDLSELQKQTIQKLAYDLNQLRPGIDRPQIEAQATRLARNGQRSWTRISIALIACVLDPDTRVAARVHMTDGYWWRDNDTRTQKALGRWVEAGHHNPADALGVS